MECVQVLASSQVSPALIPHNFCCCVVVIVDVCQLSQTCLYFYDILVQFYSNFFTYSYHYLCTSSTPHLITTSAITIIYPNLLFLCCQGQDSEVAILSLRQDSIYKESKCDCMPEIYDLLLTQQLGKRWEMVKSEDLVLQLRLVDQTLVSESCLVQVGRELSCSNQ